MITFLLKLLLLGVLFFMIKRVYEMIQYNPNAVILQINKPSRHLFKLISNTKVLLN